MSCPLCRGMVFRGVLMKQWFALHTRAYLERRVVAHLERNEIDAFLPETRDGPRATATSLAPLFPGYLFVHIDLQTTRSSSFLVPGVANVVGYGEEPVPVPEEVIKLIARRSAELTSRRGPRARFQRGDAVRIKDGPFRDMIGIFDGPSEPSERVRVLLNAMRNSMRVRLPASALEKATEEEARRTAKPPRRSRGRGRPIRSGRTARS
jgi:transcriptional antiterminator RfaH